MYGFPMHPAVLMRISDFEISLFFTFQNVEGTG
nr:MAG TPA: hypothetical protein [Caudoviricetes sp.]